MFAVIYQFQIKQGKEKEFIKTWNELTQLIYNYEGSLGSRLHKQNDQLYIAYAQWPDKETWKFSGSKLPDEADKVRLRMKESCVKIEVIYELECVKDLLRTRTN